VHLASDYIHPYKDAGGRPAHCHLRIYLPDDVRDSVVVICSELPNNPGGFVTNSAEVIAAGVIQDNELSTPLAWIEHWPEESTDVQTVGRRPSSWSSSPATRSRRGHPTSERRGRG
jgi:hypothetical protein